MVKVSHLIYPERKGYWQIKLTQTTHRGVAQCGRWVYYRDIVWC